MSAIGVISSVITSVKEKIPKGSDVASVPLKLAAPVLPREANHAVYVQGMERQKRLYELLLERN